MCKLYNLGFGLCLFFVSNFTFSITTPFVDTGNLLKPDQYTFALHSQFIANNKRKDGNVILYFDTGELSHKNVSLRSQIGVGNDGLFVGSSLKFILSHAHNQPAGGISFGYNGTIFKLYNAHYYLDFYVSPFFSHNLSTTKLLTFYIAVPMSLRFKNFKDSYTTIGIAIGIRGEVFSVGTHKKLELDVEFGKELINNINQPTATYLTIGLIVNS